MWLSRERRFQAATIASAKALGQDHARYVQGIARQPCWNAVCDRKRER